MEDKNLKILEEKMESLEIKLKNTVKIAFFMGLLSLVVIIITLYTLLAEVNATATIGKKVENLEKIHNLK